MEVNVIVFFLQVLVSVSETNPTILYLRDVEKLLLQSDRIYNLFQKFLEKLSGSVLILGSRMLEPEDDCREADGRLSKLFPHNIEIKLSEDEAHLDGWKAKLEEDIKLLQIQDNKNHIDEVLAENDIECDDLGSICQADTMVLSNYIQEIMISAISYHLMNTKDPEYRNGKLVISSNSLSHGLNIFQEEKSCGKDTLKLERNVDSRKENEGQESVGERSEPKPDAGAAETKSETNKSIHTMKKDEDNEF